jgi:hypothetical protein
VSNNLSVLCVVRHVVKEPYISIQEHGQERTWLCNQFPENFEAIHIHGRKPNMFLNLIDKYHENIRLNYGYLAKILGFIEDFLMFPLLNFIPTTSPSTELKSMHKVIQVNFPDIYLTIRWKFFAIFDYFISNTNHNFIFITTTNAYVRPYALMNLLKNIPHENIYTGAYTWPGSTFISGANIILSRDVVQKLLANRNIFRPSIIDDVELSNVLNKLSIPHFGTPLVSIATKEELKSISNDKLSENYHFRMKTSGNRILNEVSLMNLIHLRIKGIEGK